MTAAGARPRTLVLTGGTIHTLAGAGAAWVAVAGDTIAAVGDGDPPPADEVVDIGGATLVPAFCDAHVHLPATGINARGLDLRGRTTAAAIAAAFAARADAGDAILFGGNFEDPLDAPLTRLDLDRAVGPRLAMAARADLHSCVVSTALLERLPLEGLDGVDRDEGGTPTGSLRERAAAAAWRALDSSLTDAQQRDAVRTASAICLAKGVATVHEMFVVEWRGWRALEAFTAAAAEEAVDVVVYAATTDVERIVALGQRRIGGDLFLDGSFGSHTAWMVEPYLEPPPPGSSPAGLAYRTDDEVVGFFTHAHGAGLQVGVHAIGDAAIEQAISAWETVAAAAGGDSVRRLGHRIEHFECASDDHIARARALGLRASVQPAFDALWGGDGGVYARRIGRERARAMNRFATMLRSGLDLGAGSDSTVTPLDPFVQMAALRLHHVPDERLSARAALHAHTLGAVALAGEDDRKGTIEPGKLAHLALLDRDPLACDPDETAGIRVLATWVAGARAWPPED